MGMIDGLYRNGRSPADFRDTVPSRTSPLARMRGRLLLEFHRASLSWHAVRHRTGPGVSLRKDDGLIRLHDGLRQIVIPHLARARSFRGGIAQRLDSVAEKYLGDTGYTPRQGDVILDIGAGIGEFTLWCADAGARIVAFEPDPLAFACLERNLASFDGLRVFPYALWKERADLRLQASADTCNSSLIEDGKRSARVADVECWPLDLLPAVITLPVIDFMKIDGEGVEPEVLAGAARTLRRTRILSVDVSAADRRANLRARVEAVLDSFNFRQLPHGRSETIFALNTAMVGPFSTRAVGLRGF